MAYYRSVGNVPRHRHTQHRDEEGRLYAEELMGEEGFSSDSSLLYHRGIPSAVVAGTPSPLYRNAIGDECVYVESGSGAVETVFGALSYREGDYVIIPRAT